MNTLRCLWSSADKHVISPFISCIFFPSSFAFIPEIAVDGVASIVIVLVVSQNFAEITLALLALDV